VIAGFGVAEAEADPDVRAAVITATGDRAFCAGMDLRGFATGIAKEGATAFIEKRRPVWTGR
jgi:enoyl-CoA hydratase